MKFEVGKYYIHKSGMQIHILCEAETALYGNTLIAETNIQNMPFKAVSKEEISNENWLESDEEVWGECFGTPQPTDSSASLQ